MQTVKVFRGNNDYDKINLDVFHKEYYLCCLENEAVQKLLPLTNERNIFYLDEVRVPLIEQNNLNVTAKEKYRILLKLDT